MNKQFDKKFMTSNKGCYDLEKLNNCSFMKNETILLSDIVDSEIELRDKFWFVCKKLATIEQNQRISIGVASIVLEIYESKYADKAPRIAIEVAKLFLEGKATLAQLREARLNASAAAAAAASASSSVYSAAAAASAASSSVFAASAADYAASADYAAAAADYSAAASDYAAAADYAKGTNYSDLLLNFIKDFIENN